MLRPILSHSEVHKYITIVILILKTFDCILGTILIHGYVLNTNFESEDNLNRPKHVVQYNK
jgi:hypothetical protein